MKTDQQEEAKNLYFQTSMSKTEIANATGVTRRTILRWCKEDNWDKLKASSLHLPALVAEKCYYLIDAFTSRLLQDPALCFITLKDAQTIHLLATSIKKLKNRSTVNESMEMFNFFLEGLSKKDPQLAAQVLPEMEEYIAARAGREVSDFLPDGYRKNGVMDYPDKETAEQYADARDLEALQKEIEETGNYEQAIENWQKADAPLNQNLDDNDNNKDNVETHCMHLPEMTQEMPGTNDRDLHNEMPLKNENSAQRTSPAPSEFMQVNERSSGVRPGQKSDRSETFSTKKPLIINKLAKTINFPENETFQTHMNLTAHDL